MWPGTWRCQNPACAMQWLPCGTAAFSRSVSYTHLQHLRAHRRGGRLAGQQVAVRELDFQRREILRRIRLCECHLETSQMALAGHSTFKEEQNEHQ